jgi:hypothetical protein
MQSLGIWNTRVLGTFGLREGFHWFLNLCAWGIGGRRRNTRAAYEAAKWLCQVTGSASLTWDRPYARSNRCQFYLLQFTLLKENAANSSAGIVLVVFFHFRLIMDGDPITMYFSEAP